MWSVPIKQQRLILDRFRDLPFVFLTSDYATTEKGAEETASNLFVSALCIHKREGRALFRETIKDGSSFHSVRADPRTGVIEYVGLKRKIVFSPRTDGGR